MNKLARKLFVITLSSMLLSCNSSIQAGMFAKRQTYNLGTAGTITINNLEEFSDGRENFEFIKDNNKVCVEVGADEYEITVYNNSDGHQLFHTYNKQEHITKDFVLKVLETVLTNLGKTTEDEIIKKINRLFIKDEKSQTKKAQRNQKGLLKLLLVRKN